MRSSCSVQQAIFFRYRSVDDAIVPVAKVRGYADLRPEMSQTGFLRHDAQSRLRCSKSAIRSICLRSTSTHGCVAFWLKNLFAQSPIARLSSD